MKKEATPASPASASMLQLNSLDKINYIEGYDESNEEFFDPRDKAELDQMVLETANSIMDADDPKWV